MRKAIILGLVLSAGVFVNTVPADAGITPNGVNPNGLTHNGVTPNGFTRNGVTPNGFTRNGVTPNGMGRNGVSLAPGLDFTTISHQGLGK